MFKTKRKRDNSHITCFTLHIYFCFVNIANNDIIYTFACENNTTTKTKK